MDLRSCGSFWSAMSKVCVPCQRWISKVTVSGFWVPAPCISDVDCLGWFMWYLVVLVIMLQLNYFVPLCRTDCLCSLLSCFCESLVLADTIWPWGWVHLCSAEYNSGCLAGDSNIPHEGWGWRNRVGSESQHVGAVMSWNNNSCNNSSDNLLAGASSYGGFQHARSSAKHCTCIYLV